MFRKYYWSEEQKMKLLSLYPETSKMHSCTFYTRTPSIANFHYNIHKAKTLTLMFKNILDVIQLHYTQ